MSAPGCLFDSRDADVLSFDIHIFTMGYRDEAAACAELIRVQLGTIGACPALHKSIIHGTKAACTEPTEC